MKEAIKIRNRCRWMMLSILLPIAFTIGDFMTGNIPIGVIMALIDIVLFLLLLRNLVNSTKLVARWKKIEAEHQAAVDEVREKLMESLDKSTGSQGDASDVGMGSDYTSRH